MEFPLDSDVIERFKKKKKTFKSQVLLVMNFYFLCYVVVYSVAADIINWSGRAPRENVGRGEDGGDHDTRKRVGRRRAVEK